MLRLKQKLYIFVGYQNLPLKLPGRARESIWITLSFSLFQQRLLVEMEAMASRPFRPILLELYPRGSADAPNANGIICPTPTNTTPTPTAITNTTLANNCNILGTNGTANAISSSLTNATTNSVSSLNSNSTLKGNYKANNTKSCNNVMGNATSPDSLPSDTLDGMMSLKKRKKVRRICASQHI